MAPSTPAYEARLQLSVLAYNAGYLWRRLAKTGGQQVKHTSYCWLI
jgi:hypothetical protein